MIKRGIGRVPSVSICVYLWLIFLSSCSTKPTDLRTLVPAETLVYLETNDLAAALQPIVDSKPFNEVAKKKPDFSALKGVQVAVAVTGFETSEEKLTDEHSVGKVQPRFVAVAETHAWNYQAVKFAELKLGSFVETIYDSEPTLEKSEKNGGKYFTWTARDGRKAYALVIDSIIYFGNDETAIDKCLAVKRGEADSVAKSGKVQSADPATLASGYVSTDGIAQIANIAGLKFASEAGEDSEVQSAIAGVLPQLLRSSITEISWTATKTEQGIEDKYKIGMPPEVANVFNETMAAGDLPDTTLFKWLPADVPTATAYNLKNPQVAWRSILILTQKQTDPVTSKMIAALSDMVFEPYGIKNGETFFSAGVHFVTANFSPDGDKPVVVAVTAHPGKIGESLSPDLKSPTGKIDYDKINRSADGDLGAFFDEEFFVGGDAESVDRINQARPQGPDSGLNGALKFPFDPRSVAMTVGHDGLSVGKVTEILSAKKSDDAKAVSTYFTETRFTRSGMERRTVSDFGLIGSIIAQLAEN